MRINNNIMAMNTYRQLGLTNTAGSKSMEKLSSGLRINRAGDDAAGLAISEKMRGQIRGLNQASRNAQDGISLIQTAEGALQETHAILQRMRELAVQASSDTYEGKDRDEIQKEVNQLTSEINRIANTTEFNNMKLLNGERANTLEVTGTAMKSGAQVTAGGVTTSLNGTTLASGDYSLEITKTLANEAYLAEMGVATDMDYTGLQTGSTAGTNFVDGKITLDGSSTFLADSGTITLTYDEDAGTLQVKIAGGDDSSDDLILADENGNFVFNNHGVSFTLAKEGLVDGDVIEANVTTANLSAGEIVTEQKGFTDHTTASGTVASFDGGGVSVSAEAEAGVWTGVYDSTANTLTLTFTGADGTTTYEDVIDTATGDVGVYDAHGISFTFNANDSTAAEFTFTVENKYDVTATLTNTTTNQVIAEDVALATDYKNGATGAITGSIAGISLTQTGQLDNATHTFSVQQTTTGEDKSLTFQIGSNENQSMDLSISNMGAASLGITGDGDGYTEENTVTDGTSSATAAKALDVTSYENAKNAITKIQTAIDNVSAERSKLGATQNRLEHTIKNLDTSSENLQASESRIRDVDMAKEMMEFTKNNILQQAAQAMLAQAQQSPQGVLQLLR